MHTKLPNLMNKVTFALRARSQERRDEARDTLAKLGTTLGVTYLPYFVTSLRAALNEGYQLHVLGYSLHSLLQSMAEPIEAMVLENRGHLDQAALVSLVEDTPLDLVLPKVMQVFQQELFGDLSLQKNKAMSGYKAKSLREAQSTRAYDSLELLASTISFLPSPSIHVLLQPLQDVLVSSTSSVSHLRVVEEALRRISIGFSKNKDVRASNLLVYVHFLLTTHSHEVNFKRLQLQDKVGETKSTPTNWLVRESLSEARYAEEQVRARRAYLDRAKVEAEPRLTGRNRHDKHLAQPHKENKAYAHLLVEHALSLLLAGLKKNTMSAKNEGHTAMVDALVPVLACVFAQSKSPRTLVLVLRCLSSLLAWKSLSSPARYMPVVIKQIFKVLGTQGMGAIGGSKQTSGGGSQSALSNSVRSTQADLTQAAFRTLTVVFSHQAVVTLNDAQVSSLVLLVQADLEHVDRQAAAFALLKAIVHRGLEAPEIYDMMVKVTSLLFQSGSRANREAASSVLTKFLLEYRMDATRLREHFDILVHNLDYAGGEDGRLSGLQMLHSVVRRFPNQELDSLAAFLFVPLVQRLCNEESTECVAKVKQLIQALFVKVGANVFHSLVEGFVMKWLGSQDVALRMVAGQTLGLLSATSTQRLNKHVEEAESLISGALVEDAEDVQVTSTLLQALSAMVQHNHAIPTRLPPLLSLLGTPETNSHMLQLLLQTSTTHKELCGVTDYFDVLLRVLRLYEQEHLEEDLGERANQVLLWVLSQVGPCLSKFQRGDQDKDTLKWVFNRVSTLLRGSGGSNNRENSRVALFGVLLAYLPAQKKGALDLYLNVLIPPLFTASQASNKAYKEQTLAKECLQVLEDRSGSRDVFLKAYNESQAQYAKRKEKRKRVRAIAEVLNPEEAATKRVKRNQQKVQSKKRKMNRMKQKRRG